VTDQGFAADLEALRLGAGLTLRDLVRSTGIPRSTLADALAGRRTPRLETVLAIVGVCGAKPDPWRLRWAGINRDDRRKPATAASDQAQVVPLPAQLPRDVAGFASREHELSQLGRDGVVIVHGRPGVGKTALAVHWAHSVAHRYSDGQLFVNLRGHHASLNPMSPVEALGRLLSSLGVMWAPLTQDPDEGASLWRSVLARRRLLIVLDDAADAEQVRPLLPGAAGCTTVVTSRRYLADLVVRDGAGGIVLDVLPAESSVALLAQVAGADRVDAEPDAAAAVAAACGHLPLALRLAGAVMAGAPQRRFVDLVAELTGGDRLSALEGLSSPSSVEHAFELSYRALPEDAQLLFRRLGLHPGPSISGSVAALLAETDLTTAGRLLRILAEAHLLEPIRADRYRMHDLLHDYAGRLVNDADSAAARDRAYGRVLDWYASRALAISTLLDKGRERLWEVNDRHSPWEPDMDEAAAWVEAEHRNVVAAIEYDARRATGRYAWTLVDLFTGVLSRRLDVSGLVTATDAALGAAQRAGDPLAEGGMHLRRGWLRWRVGQVDGASADFARAYTLFDGGPERLAQASALRGLSIGRSDAGDLAEARAAAEAALAIYREESDRFGQAATLNTLAVIANRAADFTGTAAYLDTARVLHLDGGHRGYLALTLANLSHVHLIIGAVAQAIACAHDAVNTAREMGDAVSETVGLDNGARAYEQAGALSEAYRWATAAVARARAGGYRHGEACALDALAGLSARMGLPDASVHRDRALDLIRESGDVVAEAEFLVGAARDAYQAAIDVAAPAQSAFLAAEAAARRALDAAVVADSPHARAEALCLLAACDLGLGKAADAVTDVRRAVAMHHTSGARLAEVTARCVLAHALHQSDDADGADREWRTATQILDQLDLPDRAPLRNVLDTPNLSALPLLA
jgi:tetratricopeptide (TPR) repeat protein/transcriptional regulator with XRE-family HTH domain